MEKTGEDSYDANLKNRRCRHQGELRRQRSGSRRRNRRSRSRFRPRGRAAPGWVKGTARIQISPKGDGSELQCESEGQVGGLIAQVGSRLVEAVGKKMQDEFFGKLGQQLDGYRAVEKSKKTRLRCLIDKPTLDLLPM